MKRFFSNHWRNIFVLIPWPNRHSLSLLNNLRNPISSISNQDSDRNSHASLPSRSKACPNNSIDSIILISIRHNNSMILGSHVHLSSLSMVASGSVDVFTCSISTDEGDCFDVWVFTDLSYCFGTALDNIYYTLWNSGLF